MDRLFALISISILLVACTPTLNHIEVSPSAPASAATQTTCQPSQIQKSENSFAEIQGTMNSDGELWALLFFDEAHANEDLKIVWRITGTDEEFHAEAQNDAPPCKPASEVPKGNRLTVYGSSAVTLRVSRPCLANDRR